MKPSPSDASERCGATLRSLAITHPVPRCRLKRSSSAQLSSAALPTLAAASPVPRASSQPSPAECFRGVKRVEAVVPMSCR